MEYKNSYKGFIIWLLSFLAIFFILPFIPINDIALITRISLNFMTLYIALLSYIIYKTEYIYWYNGISYKQALEAGSEKRKLYAYKHFYVFARFALFFLLFSIIFHMTNRHYGWDIAVASAGLIKTAISTIKIKLD